VKPHKRIKRLAVYGLVSLASALLSVLPLRLALALGGLGGRFAFVFDRGDRRRAIAQLEERLGLDKKRAQAMARRVFQNIAKVGVEIALLARIRRRFAAYVELTAEARQVLDHALATKKSVIFASAHLGNFELLAQRIAHEGYDCATLARKAPNPYLGRWLLARRGAGRVETINRGEPRSARQLISALRRGAIIGVLVDQDTRVESVHVPFFGRPAATPIAAAQLALRDDLPLVLGTIARKTEGGHVIHLERVALPSSVAEATAAITWQIEERIRAHPDEWVWFHDRWKTPDCAEPRASTGAGREG
jgi:KDO2-lipid IV(A) lauroyltransferase